jgi:hypothetical protein
MRYPGYGTLDNFFAELADVCFFEEILHLVPRGQALGVKVTAMSFRRALVLSRLTAVSGYSWLDDAKQKWRQGIF